MRYKASAVSFGTFRANSFFGKKLKKRFFFLLNFFGFFFKFSFCLFGGRKRLRNFENREGVFNFCLREFQRGGGVRRVSGLLPPVSR